MKARLAIVNFVRSAIEDHRIESKLMVGATGVPSRDLIAARVYAFVKQSAFVPIRCFPLVR